jgi:hypothetical protein
MFGKTQYGHLTARTLVFAVVTILTPVTLFSQGLPRPTGSKSAAPAAATAAPKASGPVIWRDPGNVESLDLASGPGGKGGAPAPPFTFIEENLKGTNPKLKIKDANGVEWSVKWGSEVNAETVATRFVWAAGYFVEPAFFVASGKIEGVTGLTRAKSRVQDDGSFVEARFERQKDKGVKKLDEEQSWSWVENPFLGSKELNGLKVMVMLVSNWDNKDVRDVSRGSNTAIYQTPDGDQYIITDWGASFGKWGSFISREKWDCRGYQGQNKSFIKGVRNGVVEFGYSGQHSKDFTDNIKVSDVQWLLGMVGKLSDKQIADAVHAGGASAEEQACYTKAIRERIEALKRVK